MSKKIDEYFVLSQVVDGKEKRSCVFCREELLLLRQGLFYATSKDYLSKRRSAYGRINKKVFEVIG